MKILAGLLFGLLAATAASAQETCRNEETLAQCWTRVATAASGLTNEDAKEDAREEIEANAKKADQPGVNATGAQVQSTVTDLLPWLNMLGLLSDADASDGSIVADLNFLLPGTGTADKNTQLKWQLNVNPEPYEPLIAAFPEAVREERKSALDGELDDTADSELQFTWSLVNQRFGRDFRQHRDTLNAIVEPLYREARAAVSVATPGLEFMQTIAPFVDSDKPLDVKVSDLGAKRDAVVTAVVLGAQQTGSAQKALLDHLRPKLQAAHVDRLAELVLQQPQLLLSATRRLSDDLVGPDAWGAKLTYEHSFANFGAFLRSTPSCDPRSAANRNGAIDATACYPSLNKYLNDHAEDIEKGSRWQVSLEYAQTDAITYDYPDDSVHLEVPKIDRLIASIGYGRTLPRSKAADRVDLQAAYDSNLDNDAENKSRFVASFTYTRRIADLDVPIGIVYANKSEFFDDADHQIGMHIGVRFRAPE